MTEPGRPEQRGTETGRFSSAPADAAWDLRRAFESLAGEPNSEETRRRVADAVGRIISRAAGAVLWERTRDQRRDGLAAIFHAQMAGEEPGARLGAAAAAAYLHEAFVFGIPEDYDPRARLGEATDAALDAVCRRFAWGEGLPSQMAWYERMRRQGKVADWSFERRGESEAAVMVKPSQPAEIIEVDFALFEDGGARPGGP